VPLELVEIPAGEFLMGDDNDSSASPRHRVQIPHSFWMGKYPITQAQWQAVAELPQVEQELDPDPSAFKGEHHPVEMVSWYEAEEFCRRLSQYSGETFDLPTEAEWEYAARGGTTTDYHFGDEMIMELANYDGPNAVDQTTPVGDYGVANRFGLLDIHGNVWEWCLDHWHKNYEEKPEELKQNGSTSWLTSDEAESRLLRGGSWGLNAENCRSAYRTDFSLVYRVDLIGFRVVCRSSRTR
jgi:formylglycine-generating enzyme required for sulfatase activity